MRNEAVRETLGESQMYVARELARFISHTIAARRFHGRGRFPLTDSRPKSRVSGPPRRRPRVVYLEV